jgi:hypothetical protein
MASLTMFSGSKYSGSSRSSRRRRARCPGRRAGSRGTGAGQAARAEEALQVDEDAVVPVGRREDAVDPVARRDVDLLLRDLGILEAEVVVGLVAQVLGDVAGLLRTGLIDRTTAEADARPLRPLVPLPIPRDGYYFRVLDADGSEVPPVPYRQETDRKSGKVHNESKFGFVAYPAEPGVTGDDISFSMKTAPSSAAPPPCRSPRIGPRIP